MIKKLRRKFVIISSIIISIVFILLISLINAMNFHSMKENADKILNYINDHEGRVPQPGMMPGMPDEFFTETPFATRYFSLKVNVETKTITINREHIHSITEEQAIDYMNKVSKGKKEKGFIETYRYLVASHNNELHYYFLNCEKDLANFYTYFTYSILFGLLILALTILFIYYLSGFAMKPTIESYQKQKRFITNAGHELKTPLSVISANAEILEMEIGDNEWIQSIENQVTKLNQLTKNLILLSRMEENDFEVTVNNFNLSEALKDVINSFNPIIESKQFKLNTDIEENLILSGNEELIRQMFSLLIDNALKYSSEKNIEIKLTKENKNIVYAITNEANNIEEGNQDKLFERFYRLDTSRNTELGGSGIGLSIVKTIVESHKGKIEAYSNDGKSLEFKITL